MEEIFSKDIKLKKVIVKSGAELNLIELDKNHFYIEQNPEKNSKYGKAYRLLKEKCPEYYMFWEMKNNHYTGKVLIGAIFKKKYADEFITKILDSEIFKEYEDMEDNEI